MNAVSILYLTIAVLAVVAWRQRKIVAGLRGELSGAKKALKRIENTDSTALIRRITKNNGKDGGKGAAAACIQALENWRTEPNDISLQKGFEGVLLGYVEGTEEAALAQEVIASERARLGVVGKFQEEDEDDAESSKATTKRKRSLMFGGLAILVLTFLVFTNLGSIKSAIGQIKIPGIGKITQAVPKKAPIQQKQPTPNQPEPLAAQVQQAQPTMISPTATPLPIMVSPEIHVYISNMDVPEENIPQIPKWLFQVPLTRFENWKSRSGENIILFVPMSDNRLYPVGQNAKPEELSYSGRKLEWLETTFREVREIRSGKLFWITDPTEQEQLLAKMGISVTENASPTSATIATVQVPAATRGQPKRR